MFFHVLIFIFDFKVVLMCFELVFCVKIQVGKLEEWSHGENKGKQGRKKQRFSHFLTTLLVVRNFRTTHPLCENAFVPIFKKCMLSVPLCEFYRNANLVRIHFWDKFSKPCSLSRYSTWMRNFRTTQGVVRNLHFLFKGRVLLFQCSISSSFLIAPLFRSPNPFLKFLFFIIPHSQHHHGSPSP